MTRIHCLVLLDIADPNLQTDDLSVGSLLAEFDFEIKLFCVKTSYEVNLRICSMPGPEDHITSSFQLVTIEVVAVARITLSEDMQF